ncbi:MAG: MmgE/PrpD family protein [bacterium]|nr:MmgE/PrpD family protein [bacterium]
MTAAQRLAATCVAWRDATPDAAVVARTRAFLLDWLGVTLGGAPEPSSVALRRGLALLGTPGDAPAFGTCERFAPIHAALANGAAAHTLEMDDTHQAGSIHLGATMFAAAFAAAARRPETTLDAALRAVAAGYEVTGRLAMALDPAAHYRRGFHPTGTCGAFGAAATAALLLGQDADGVANALGIAGSQAAGSMEFLADGTWTKRFHPGWAAHAGLHAAALAAAGFRAPATILEGRFGTLHAYSDAAEVAKLDDGPEPVVLRTSVKPHACCRYMQAPIDAVLGLRAAHGLRPGDVERIEVGIVAAGFPIVCEPLDAKRRPATVVDAQFSLPFGVAVALLRGQASPDEFVPSVFGDATITTLMDRVEPRRDPALDAAYPQVWPAWVKVVTRAGAVHDAHVRFPLGDPENFPGDPALLAKFRRLAARALAPDAVERVADAATTLRLDAPLVRLAALAVAG